MAREPGAVFEKSALTAGETETSSNSLTAPANDERPFCVGKQWRRPTGNSPIEGSVGNGILPARLTPTHQEQVLLLGYL